MDICMCRRITCSFYWNFAREVNSSIDWIISHRVEWMRTKPSSILPKFWKPYPISTRTIFCTGTWNPKTSLLTKRAISRLQTLAFQSLTLNSLTGLTPSVGLLSIWLLRCFSLIKTVHRGILQCTITRAWTFTIWARFSMKCCAGCHPSFLKIGKRCTRTFYLLKLQSPTMWLLNADHYWSHCCKKIPRGELVIKEVPPKLRSIHGATASTGWK